VLLSALLGPGMESGVGGWSKEIYKRIPATYG
jgi:hypothetical protein